MENIRYFYFSGFRGSVYDERLFLREWIKRQQRPENRISGFQDIIIYLGRQIKLIVEN